MEKVDDIKGLCEKLVDSKMKVCPGISVEEYESYKEVIRYDQKKVHITNDPFTRIASVKCLLWFPMPRNMDKQKMTSKVVCTECATLKRNLRKATKRLSSVTPAVKVQHQQAESTFPLMYLSPTSLKTRKMNIKCQRIKERRMIKKYVPDKVILDDQQHQEMCQIHSSIEEIAGDELESLFVEGEQRGQHVGSTLRQVWESDKRSQHAASVMSFQEDQERNSKQCMYMYNSICIP